MKIQLNKLTDIELDGISTKDSPDFCDAFVSSALIEEEKGSFRELTNKELDYLNEHEREFVYEKVIDYVY